MIAYITDQKPGETDILSRLRFGKLTIRDLEGKIIFSQDSPVNGWSHMLLNDIQPVASLMGADAYINNEWVGSTEV